MLSLLSSNALAFAPVQPELVDWSSHGQLSDVEAAKLLSFTEDEFSKAIELGSREA